MTDPIILFRSEGLEAEGELEAARKHFAVIDSRLDIHRNELVIGRYSVYPYYQELEKDVIRKGAKLVNSYREHLYVADVMSWALDLDEMTPMTWRHPSEAPRDCAFVLKGKTYSKKFLWDTHMFAPDFRQAMEVYCRLQDDALIGSEGIYLRRYVPLRQLDVGPHGLPISEEYRFFVLYGQVVSAGFYWSSYPHLVTSEITPATVPKDFLEEAISRVEDRVSFFTMDVARTEKGDWIVVELNDGQMSGLSENDPDTFYRRLREVLVVENEPGPD